MYDMSNTESTEAILMYSCDTCGKRFTAVEDAQIHDRNAHRELAPKGDSDHGL
jgi:transcriptional regulator NrdR family protein